jgi:hypothetical protein
VGAVLLAVAALAVWFGLTPSNTSTGALEVYDAAISEVLSDDQENQLRADTAPQQQVVNGWTARDLLTVIARQGTVPTVVEDQRPAALLLLAVLGIALIAFTGGVAVSRHQPAGADFVAERSVSTEDGGEAVAEVSRHRASQVDP